MFSRHLKMPPCSLLIETSGLLKMSSRDTCMGFAPGLPMGADEPRQDGSRPAVKAEPCSYYCQEEYLTVLVDLGPQGSPTTSPCLRRTAMSDPCHGCVAHLTKDITPADLSRNSQLEGLFSLSPGKAVVGKAGTRSV